MFHSQLLFSFHCFFPWDSSSTLIISATAYHKVHETQTCITGPQLLCFSVPFVSTRLLLPLLEYAGDFSRQRVLPMELYVIPAFWSSQTKTELVFGDIHYRQMDSEQGCEHDLKNSMLKHQARLDLSLSSPTRVKLTKNTNNSWQHLPCLGCPVPSDPSPNVLPPAFCMGLSWSQYLYQWCCPSSEVAQYVPWSIRRWFQSLESLKRGS